MKLIIKIGLGVLLNLVVFARAIGQQEQSGDLVAHLNTFINSIPGASSNLYQYPNGTQSQTWKEIIQAIVDEEYVTATTKATQLSYTLIKFTDNTETEEKVYYVLERATAGANYWGTYVFNPTACRSQLVIQSPHPVFDSNTGKQGIYVFKKVDAAAFFVSGTHRCNSTTATNCSGTTEVCGSSQAYRISDVAHNTLGAFHLATEVLNTNFTAGVFVQLHGFAKQAGDPSAIMSNGTRTTPTVDYIGNLQSELVKLDATLTFKAGHLDFTWDRLLGTTNTQGRLINKSVVPCSTNATTTKGKFLHIEQEYDKLRANVQKWDIMAQAMTEVFACGTVTSTPEEDRSLGVLFYPNPFNNQLNILTKEAVAPLVLEIYSMDGSRIVLIELRGNQTLDMPSMEEGTYLYLIKNKSQIIDQGKLVKTCQ